MYQKMFNIIAHVGCASLTQRILRTIKNNYVAIFYFLKSELVMKNLSLIGILLGLLTSCLATKKTTTLDSNNLTAMSKPATDMAAAASAPPQKTESSSQLPQLINHSRPPIQMDIKTLLNNAHCQPTTTQVISGCDDLRTQMGCDQLELPNPLWGAITPVYPLISCIIFQTPQRLETMEQEGYITQHQDKLNYYRRYVIWKDNKFQLIKQIEELQSTFAPIKSAAEALSYALMATPFQAQYQQTLNSSYRYYVNTIEDTHVVSTDKDYQVLLYTKRKIGCGSHPTSTVLVTVNRNGLISYPSQQLAYVDPAEDNLCINSSTTNYHLISYQLFSAPLPSRGAIAKVHSK